MKSLIRPFLFTFARLGLFLAVVAWIVGQWWLAACVVPLSRTTAAVHLSSHGWVITHRGILSSRQFWLALNDNRDDFEWLFEEPATHYRGLPQTLRYGLNVPGLVFSDYSTVKHISFRHWLVVTLFALTCGVLKWVYRKRIVELSNAHASLGD